MTSDPGERRAEERFPAPAHVACAFASPVLEDFGKVRILNISRMGIGLIAAEPIALDFLLAIKLVNSIKNFSKTLLVRVVHVTPQVGGSYLIGGTLDAPLTYDELCAFTL